MKIIIGNHTYKDFHVYDDEGTEITDTLHIKNLRLYLGYDDEPTTVQLTCYVDSVELLNTMAEVTIIPREGESI